MYNHRSRKRKTPEQLSQEAEEASLRAAQKLERCLCCRFYDEHRKPKCSKTYKEIIKPDGTRVCVWWKRKWAEGIIPIDLEE